jgi:putative PIN family toxin of toxin-antitoxin system
MQNPPVHAPSLDGPPLRAVLDTQVVLDWLVFRDAGCKSLVGSIESGSLHWLTSRAMRDELEHVLYRGVCASWGPDLAAIALAFDHFALVIERRTPSGLPLRCSDPDDQMFIDLALTGGASWLFTRDRALLKLARRARERGVKIVKPSDWNPSAPTTL